MSNSDDLRRRAISWFAVAVLGVTSSCASGATSASPSPAPGQSPSTGTTSAQPGATPQGQGTWPVRTREHVDLWLHSYALLSPDSALVPYFERGYRTRMLALRRQRGISSQLDANRALLLERINVQPSIGTGPQFLPFYFASWEQMRQAIDLFIRANGDPRATNDQNLQTYFAILASSFQSAPDREWLRMFAASVQDEREKFYLEHWTAETRTRTGVVARVDSLWQRAWRPALQRFLNNTQQQNGEVYLSLPLDGEGRTVHFGKLQNAVGIGMPDDMQGAESVLYGFAHEIAGQVASTAIDDNTTPADRRAGASARYEQSAAVRAGALLLERTIPSAVSGYMRYYLQAAGRPAPADPRSAFTAFFSVPTAVSDAIARQLEVILGGI
ncbi:MAG: hypothetical protein ABIP93_03460 [Gemmatimonadaceae bacterium]